MAQISFVSGGMDDAERRERLFHGEFLVFKNIAAMRKLCGLADELARSAFSDSDPETAHHRMTSEEYLAIVDPLQRRFTNSEVAKTIFADVLKECGADLETTFWDWFPLRIQPGEPSHDSMSTAGLHVHRDSWYSNMYSQNNWWAPIYPLEPERSMVLFPNYFDQPIKNNSKGWDLHEFRAARAAVRKSNHTSEDVRNAYPAVSLREEIDRSSELIIAMEPGDILCFSLVHLHGSIPNKTERARFSTEIRTINIADIRSGRGAPNVDSLSTGEATEDFFRIKDRQPLIEALGS